MDQFAVICMLFCIMLSLNTTYGCVFVDVTAFRTLKSISKSNVVNISPLAAEI